MRASKGCHDCRLTGVDWRQKIENQRGAVLATELKNNANKLAQWTAGALVAGIDVIKLGYVSRAHQRSPAHHVILSTQVGCSRWPRLATPHPSLLPWSTCSALTMCCALLMSTLPVDGL